MWRVSEISLENAFKFEKRFVVERDAIKIGRLDAAFFQTEVDGILGEREIVLLAREPFFLSRGHDCPVPDETRRTVMIKRRDA